MYLNSMNYYRGIAILFIIAGHTLELAGWCISTFPEKIIANIIVGGTPLFVFLSGFFFHHIYFKKYNYKSFMETKTMNVFLPYLFLSIAPVLYNVFFVRSGPGTEFIFAHYGDGFYYEYIQPIILYLCTGRIFMAYWYIPFIMIIFLLSPFFIWFIKQTNVSQFVLIAGFVVISMFLHRPVDNILVFQSVVYFIPVYMIGIVASIYKEFIFNFFRGKEIYLLLLVIGCSCLQSMTDNSFGNYHKEPFIITMPDIQIIQKIFLCFFFMALLSRFENMKITLLDNLASSSFALFFIHPIIIEIFIRIIAKWDNIFGWIPGGFLWIIITPIVVYICYYLSYFIKCNVPFNRSRMIIGW